MNFPTQQEIVNLAQRSQNYCDNNGGIDGLLKLLNQRQQQQIFAREIISALNSFNSPEQNSKVRYIITNLFNAQNNERLTNVKQSFNWINRLI